MEFNYKFVHISSVNQDLGIINYEEFLVAFKKWNLVINIYIFHL